MAPFDIHGILGGTGATLLLLLIGFAFGFILERAGFGDSRKLAGQFYFTDLAVIRVMFAAIVTAMLLLAWSTRLGLLDFSQIWVNPTFLWPGILGGLIMGVGFIIGGYCPGTSLVASVTLKIDGIFFVLGGLTGMFIFGETADKIMELRNWGSMGRLTLQDVFHLGTGGVGVLVAFMAIAMFAFSTFMKRLVTGKPDPLSPFRVLGAVTLVGGMGLLALLPDLDEATLWQRFGTTWQADLDARKVQIDPRELAALVEDDLIKLHLIDLRQEADFHLFHLEDAQSFTLESLQTFVDSKPSDKAVTILMSNGEVLATQAWRQLKLARLSNVYLLEGGVNHWLDTYAHAATKIQARKQQVRTLEDGRALHPDSFNWAFEEALGARHFESRAPSHHGESDHEDFEKKVVIERKSKKAGGCG
jgi:rhodanese-related sulfurtransferase